MKLDNFVILAVLTLDHEKTTLLAKEHQAGFHPYIGRQPHNYHFRPPSARSDAERWKLAVKDVAECQMSSM